MLVTYPRLANSHHTLALACHTSVCMQIPAAYRATFYKEHGVKSNLDGLYTLTKRQIKGLPVWKHTKKDRFIRCMKSNKWGITTKEKLNSNRSTPSAGLTR